MERNRLIAGYILVFAGSAMFASKAIFIKLAYLERPDPLLILVWRMIFSLPFFAAVGIWVTLVRRREGRPRPERSALIKTLLVGFVGYYIAMILDFAGLLYVTAQLERLALFTYPIFLIAIAAAFFGSKLKTTDFVAAGLSYAGLAVVFLTDFKAGGSNVPLGTALVLASALSFALYQLLAKDLIARLGSALFTSVALSSAAIASLIHVLVVKGGIDMHVSANYLMLAAGTGLVATVIPSFLVNGGMASIGPQSTAMISTLSPLMTIVLAVIILDERFTLIDAFGTALVVGGIGFHTWRDMSRASASDEQTNSFAK
jgi:drug/metabolite transporter (DMT)-like permease